MAVKGSELLARSLANWDVDRIYGLHGGHIQPLFGVLPDYDIDLVDTRDEQAATHMAHTESQISNSVGVAAVTAGPGVTNTLTAVANAYYNHLPALIIGGCESTKQFERRSLQGLGQKQVEMFEPVTKWAETILEPSRFPEYVATAMRHALAPRPGPSFLNVPLDVFQERIPETQLENGVVQSYSPHETGIDQHPDPGAIEALVSAVEAADRPLVISGIGLVNADVGDRIKRVLDVAPMPYLGTADSAGFLAEDHPLNMNAARSSAAGQADLIILIGKSLDFGLAYGSDVFFAEDVTFAQIDADPREIGRNRPIDVPVAGDEAAALDLLIERLRDTEVPSWSDWINSLQADDEESRQRLEESLDSAVGDDAVHPWRLCSAVRERLDTDAYLACEGGDILSFCRIALSVDEPGHLLQPGPYGCLGAAVPGCISAALLEPDTQVVGVIGDGSFGFSAMELETAARHGADVTFVVANNAAWNSDRLDQIENHDHVVGTELGQMRYDLIAEAVGGHGEHVKSDDEMGSALDRALAFDGPAVVNVVTDRDVLSPDYKRGMHADEAGDMVEFQVVLAWERAEEEKRS